MLHIKLKTLEHRIPCKLIFSVLKHTLNIQMGTKGQNLCLTKSSHVAYHTTSAPGGGVKCQILFSESSHLHIKLMRMERRAPCKHILCSYSHTRPLGRDQKIKIYFTENSHVAYQIKGNGTQSSKQVHILSLHTHPESPDVIKRP